MLKGSIVALVTPFRAGKIDYNAVDKLLDFHLENGTDGILLCGTTGESPALAGDEKAMYINYCVHKLKGRIPLIKGTGTNNLSRTISATNGACKEKVDYALVITPYYNKPTQTGLYNFFTSVSKNVDIPIIIYNVPGRTGVNITSETTCRLAAECDNIVGIKEASGNLVQASEIIRDTGDDFVVYSGEDALNYPLMCCGAEGVISVTANIVPKLVHELAESCLQQDYTKAQQLHLQLLSLNRAMFIETNPIPVKETLAMMGMIERELRPPMSYMAQENMAKLKKVLKSYKLI